MGLQRDTHHVYRLQINVSLLCGYRNIGIKCSVIRTEVLKGIIERIGYDYDIDIVELEIPEDHIHMVVRGEPKKAPSDIILIQAHFQVVLDRLSIGVLLTGALLAIRAVAPPLFSR